MLHFWQNNYTVHVVSSADFKQNEDSGACKKSIKTNQDSMAKKLTNKSLANGCFYLALMSFIMPARLAEKSKTQQQLLTV